MIRAVHLAELLGRTLPDDASQGIEEALSLANVRNVTQLSLFLGQVSVETARLRWLVELDNGQAYEGRRDLGNVYPGDGAKYRGRGCLQLTGRTNYREAGRFLVRPYEEMPELVGEFPDAWRVAGWFWWKHKLADARSVVQVTKTVTGGHTALARRIDETRTIALRAGKSEFWLDYFGPAHSTR